MQGGGRADGGGLFADIEAAVVGVDGQVLDDAGGVDGAEGEGAGGVDVGRR